MALIIPAALGTVLSREHSILIFMTSILGGRCCHAALLVSLHRSEPICLGSEVPSQHQG